MNIDEIMAKDIRNGSIYDLETVRPLKMRKAFESEQIFKHTMTSGQFGVKFENKKQYNEEYKANHTEEVPEWLKFHWVVENLIGQYDKSGKQFIRLNDIGTVPKTEYYKIENGKKVVVDKETAKTMCLASEFNHKPNDSGCITQLLSNVVGFARNH